jgi:hypothetical protein
MGKYNGYCIFIHPPYSLFIFVFQGPAGQSGARGIRGDEGPRAEVVRATAILFTVIMHKLDVL